MRSLIFLIIGTISLVADNRSFDGSGNNLKHPEWGSSGSTFQRLGEARYADGMGSLDEAERPNPRHVSNMLAAQESASMNRRGLSNLVWCWGQFLDHDIALSLQATDEFIPVMLEDGDVLAPMIPVVRSQFDPASGTSGETPRQQINHTTAFIDASQVYGQNEERANSLRTFEGGKLITSVNETIPLNEALIEMENPSGLPAASLYMAGDLRANENPALISIHSLWLREHNRWAERIAAKNPEWDDEAIYQKARKLVGALIQNITYSEFLVALLGEHAPSVDEAVYDNGLNPGMFNEVAAALYRIGHTMISSRLNRMDDSDTVVPDSQFKLMDVFFRPSFVSNREFAGQLLKALACSRMQEIDPMVIDDLRNALFGVPGQGGMDLITLNLQRARDHGIPTYNETREDLGLERVSDFEEITSNPALAQALEAIYGNVDTVDLWIGAMAEDHLSGAGVGELLATGLALQFRHLRDGDRFFFINDVALTSEEKEMIRNTTLANVIMRNTQMTSLAEQAFVVPGWVDSDGDRTTDEDEAVAGTDPIDARSVFQVTGFSMLGGEMAIHWSSVPGKHYSIQQQDTLTALDGWQEISNLVASSGRSQFAVPFQEGPVQSPSFYRILTQEE